MNCFVTPQVIDVAIDVCCHPQVSSQEGMPFYPATLVDGSAGGAARRNSAQAKSVMPTREFGDVDDDLCGKVRCQGDRCTRQLMRLSGGDPRRRICRAST